MRHQLRPLFDRIVIKELDPDRVRRSGLLIPPGHRAQLIAAMEAMIASPDRRHRMGRAARQKIEADADPGSHRRKIVALMTQAANGDESRQ